MSYTLIILIFNIFILAFLIKREQFLICLLILEMIVLYLLINIIHNLDLFLEIQLRLVIIVFIVIERILGLIVLVVSVRSHGNNIINLFFKRW